MGLSALSILSPASNGGGLLRAISCKLSTTKLVISREIDALQ
jgi:hypothetical protein